MGRAPWGGPHGAGAAAVKRSMKTSDLHVAESGSNGSGSSLRTLLGLDWLGGRKAKQKKKFKAGTHPSAGGQPDAKTKVRQSADDVLKLLRADAAHRIGVFGGRDFAETFAAQGSDIQQVWISNDFVKDIPAGAKPLNAENLRGLDAVVVGGEDVGTRFRYALRLVGALAPTIPVHWVAENWEFCAGTAPYPLRSTMSTRWSSIISKSSSASRTPCSSASR